MTDSWGIAAAVATSVSALFVAWQAGETRRATKISQNALKSAQTVALDAARSRLDDQAPQVAVHLSDAAWPPLGSSSGWPQPWPAVQAWHFPRDEDVLLALRVTLHVTNHSNRPVHVTFQGDLYQPYVEGAARSESRSSPDGPVRRIQPHRGSMVPGRPCPPSRALQRPMTRAIRGRALMRPRSSGARGVGRTGQCGYHTDSADGSW